MQEGSNTTKGEKRKTRKRPQRAQHAPAAAEGGRGLMPFMWPCAGTGKAPQGEGEGEGDGKTHHHAALRSPSRQPLLQRRSADFPEHNNETPTSVIPAHAMPRMPTNSTGLGALSDLHPKHTHTRHPSLSSPLPHSSSFLEHNRSGEALVSSRGCCSSCSGSSTPATQTSYCSTPATSR